MEHLNVDPSLAQLCSQYSITKILGEGGFGIVYRAVQQATQRDVALKCINLDKTIKAEKNARNRELKEKFLVSEVEIMKSCESENIVKCLDEFESDKWKVIVLQFCEGGSLYDVIEKKGKLPQHEAIEILGQLMMGFAILHKNKIVHRDLKTQNILISNGVYKIADLGLAKKTGQLTKSMRGTTVGSKITIAPEVQNNEPYDVQADLWSLGVMYYEILTGEIPFSGFVTQKTVQTFYETLENLGLSEKSKNFLRSVLVFRPSQRLKWLQLYKMYNTKTGIFQGYVQQIRQPPQLKIPDPSKLIPSQFAQPSKEEIASKEKGRHSVTEQTKTQTQEQSIIKDYTFQKMADNFKIASKIQQDTLKVFTELLGQPRQKDQRELQMYINHFCVLVASQVCKLIEDNDVFLHPKQVMAVIINDQENIEKNKTIIEFNNFNRLMKAMNTLLLNEFTKLNHKSFLDYFNDEVFLSSEQVKILQKKYLTHKCTEEEHISYTLKSFKRMCENVKKNRNSELAKAIDLMKKFMGLQYKDLILNRER